jgi:hypothetical protein
MTNAERQRAYRQRQAEVGKHLSVWVDVTAKRALERLSCRYGVTQRAMLERVLVEAESRTVEGLKDKAAYYDGMSAQQVADNMAAPITGAAPADVLAPATDPAAAGNAQGQTEGRAGSNARIGSRVC